MSPALHMIKSYSELTMIKTSSPRQWSPRAAQVERRRRLAVACVILCVIVFAFYNASMVSSTRPINSILSTLFPIDSSSIDEHPHHNQSDKFDDDPITYARFAYLIGGVGGEEERVWRTIRVVYHPLNHYIVHLDASEEAISAFAGRLSADPVYSEVGNVMMMMKPDRITYCGPTMVANTLHAAAILLRRTKNWDWFINLSPADYPLVSQDDLIHVFSTVQRNLSFIDNTKELGGKLGGRGQAVIIDPGLHLKKKFNNIFSTKERREVPDAFTYYTGSAWLVLSRAFMDYCISGYDNLPRTLLMFHANVVVTTEFYFQTVICNSDEFIPTVVNNDMHFIRWDYPHPKQHPITLTMAYLDRMIASNEPFARKFRANDPVLDVIDSKYLGRGNQSNGFTYGGWCSGFPLCSRVGNATNLVPGLGATRLKILMDTVLNSYENKCNSTHPFI